MVSPAQKRRAAGSVVDAERCSRRQACRYLGLLRSTWHYMPLPPTPRPIQLEREIIALSRHHPRYGYRRIHAVLPRKGLKCALRTVQRIRRREGLQLLGPAVRPKCPPRPDAKIKSDGVNDVWCIDVVFDTTQHGTTVKFLTLLDEFSHYNLDIGCQPGAWAAARSRQRSMRRWLRTASRPICAATMAESSSPLSSRNGCRKPASRPGSLNPVAPGRMESTRASTAVSATST
jgi:hypothetical protein